jgi:uncharacterized membrane protein YeaQ/YmgE (transglycosylase-associated protein family)
MLWTILIGFVIGLLARAIKPGQQAIGWIMTTFIGVGGAVLATYIGQQLGWYAPGARAGFLASVGGAIILLFVYEVLSRPLLRRAKADPPAE